MQGQGQASELWPTNDAIPKWKHEGTRCCVSCVYVHVHCGASEATFEWQYACFPYSLEKFVTSSTHCSTTVSGCATAGSALGPGFNRPPGFATRGGRRAWVSNLRDSKKRASCGGGERHMARGRVEGAIRRRRVCPWLKGKETNLCALSPAGYPCCPAVI
jgi:hypothetical protein